MSSSCDVSLPNCSRCDRNISYIHICYNCVARLVQNNVAKRHILALPSLSHRMLQSKIAEWIFIKSDLSLEILGFCYRFCFINSHQRNGLSVPFSINLKNILYFILGSFIENFQHISSFS